MKKLSVTCDHSVTLFNRKTPLPMNIVYGQVNNVVYTYVPYTGHLEVYDTKGNYIKGRFPEIKEMLRKFQSVWYPLQYKKPIYCEMKTKKEAIRKAALEKRPCEGAPIEKKAQSEYIYRCKPLSGEWNDDLKGMNCLAVWKGAKA